MDELVNMIYSEDINMLLTNMFVFVLCIDLIFGIGYLIKTIGKGSR